MFKRHHSPSNPPSTYTPHTHPTHPCRYGRQYVPLGDHTAAVLKYEVEKGITLLGFVDAEDIPR